MKKIIKYLTTFAFLIGISIPAQSTGLYLSVTNPPPSINLSWVAPVITNANQTISGYNIYYGVSSLNYTNKILSSGTNTTFTVSNLNRGSTYFLSVTAIDNWGNESQFSNEATNQVLFPPSAPQLKSSVLNY